MISSRLRSFRWLRLPVMALAILALIEVAVDFIDVRSGVSRSASSSSSSKQAEHDAANTSSSGVFEEEEVEIIYEKTGNPYTDQLTDPPLSAKVGKKKVIYSLARWDRSGAAIRDMIKYHNFCYDRKCVYGGACPLRRTHGWSEEVLEERLQTTRRILKRVGLDRMLPIRCPPGIDTSRSAGLEHRVPPFHLTGKDFPRKLGLTNLQTHSEHLPKTYLRYLRFEMRKRLKVKDKAFQDEHKGFTIVAHVRRGDVSMCNKWKDRYLPNAYFLELIEQYRVKHLRKTNGGGRVRVIIHSEPEDPEVRQVESLDEFRELGHEVKLQASESHVWKDIIHNADVVLLSKSSFSIVPALLVDHKSTVVYYPYDKIPPMPAWRVPGRKHQAWVNDLNEELQKRCGEIS